MLISRHEGIANLETVATMRAMLNRDGLGMHVSQEILDDLSLAVSELAANSVKHSAVPPASMAMEVHVEGTTLRIVLTDDGSPFADFERRWADCQMAPMDPLSESGRGLWLIRTSVDRLSYETGKGNRWTFWRGFRNQEKPSILLVEDDAAVRGLFVSVLSKMARVDCAGSVREGAEALQDTRYDLVIADYNLGDGNSSELLSIRPGPAGPIDMPFIFVTSDRTGKARDTGLQHGIHTILQKPVRPRELRERAAEAMAAHNAHSVRASLRLASDVDATIDHSAPLETGRIRLVARNAIASTGGGDIFLDLGSHAGNRRFMLADCAGHGMPARMQAALLSGIACGLSPELTETADRFIAELSKAVYRGGPAGGLVSTVLAVDIGADGRIGLATGGHPSPLLIGADGTIRPVALTGALPGLLADCGSIERRIELQPGERLLLATDGMAPDSGEVLEKLAPSIASTLARLPALPMEAAADLLADALRSEYGTYPADDWTFVLVESAGFQPASR